MSFIWADDDPLIDTDAELRHDQEERPFCEHCGEFCDRLVTVEDRDDSVGYRDEIQVCEDCVKRARRRR